MHTFKRGFIALSLASFVGGCGTTVPSIQEFWGPHDAATKMVARITAQVECEIGHAVSDAIGVDKSDNSKIDKRRLTFLDNWIAELVLILLVEEKSASNPSVSYINPISSTSLFSLGFGLGASTEASRTDKVHLFFPVQMLLKKYPYDPKQSRASCKPTNTDGILFSATDLRIYEWLHDTILNRYTERSENYGDIAEASLKGAFTHDILFTITTSGQINPSWKLNTVSTNTGMGPYSASLLGASRSRQQELILTLGPSGGTADGQAARNATFSSELSADIASKTSLVVQP